MDAYWLCIRLLLKDRWEPFLRYRRRVAILSSLQFSAICYIEYIKIH